MSCLNAYQTTNSPLFRGDPSWIILAIKVLHFMKTKTRGEDMYVDLKLDISKTYDCTD